MLQRYLYQKWTVAETPLEKEISSGWVGYLGLHVQLCSRFGVLCERLSAVTSAFQLTGGGEEGHAATEDQLKIEKRSQQRLEPKKDGPAASGGKREGQVKRETLQRMEGNGMPSGWPSSDRR